MTSCPSGFAGHNESNNTDQHLCTYLNSPVHVGAKPHRLIWRSAPPGLARYAWWISGYACLTRVHVAVHFNGILCTALVWIHPVLTWKDDQILIVDKAMNTTDSRPWQINSLTEHWHQHKDFNISITFMIHGCNNRHHHHLHQHKSCQDDDNSYYNKAFNLPLFFMG